MSTFPPNMSRCMGNPGCLSFCQKCARLPRSEREENHARWLHDPRNHWTGKTCSFFVVTEQSFFSDKQAKEE